MMSTPMIGSQPTAFAAIKAPIPTAPSPKMMIPSPALASSTLSTLPAPVWKPHPSGPSSSSGRSSGTLTAL